MQQSSEMQTVCELIGFFAVVGAAGYKYYQCLTVNDEAALQHEREIINTQKEQLEDLKVLTAELGDITTANATLLQDSEAQLRELEMLTNNCRNSL